jgi:hypothetical protein
MALKDWRQRGSRRNKGMRCGGPLITHRAVGGGVDVFSLRRCKKENAMPEQDFWDRKVME